MIGHSRSGCRPTRDHLRPPKPEASDRTCAKRPSFPRRTDLGRRATPADQGRELQRFGSRLLFILSGPAMTSRTAHDINGAMVVFLCDPDSTTGIRAGALQ